MNDQRPDPDELLRRIREQEERERALITGRDMPLGCARPSPSP